MAGDSPALSAFAARKRLLARISEPRSTGTTEDENGEDAGAGAAGGGRGSSDSAGGGTRGKRTSGRRKRQRVETTSGKEQGQEVTVQSETTPEATCGRKSRSTPKLEATGEPSQSPAEPPRASALNSETVVVEKADSGDPVASALGAPGASSETPARNQFTSATPAKEPLSGPLPPFVTKEIIRDGITMKGKGVIELCVDQVDRLRLPVVGQYGVRVIRGEASIAGATLHPSSEVTWIHSSLCYSSPLLRCPDASVLELHPHPAWEGLRDLGRLSPLFRGIWNRVGPKHGGGASAYQILCGPEDLPKRSIFQPLYSPPEWNKKLSELTDMVKLAPILVCGPKGSGKSTFSRFLTNRLLTQTHPRKSKSRETQRGVVLLDLDPGQPEFCPAGMVSLLLVQKPNISPPFAHPWPDDESVTLIRCHTLASVTPGSDPDLFMECALDLYSQYQKAWNGYPLVVNSPGWILGTGLDLLSSVIAHMRPREVVYMSEDGPAETVDGLQSACKRTSSFSTLPSQQSDSGARKTAGQLRAMQAMAYFHTLGKAKTPSHVSWNSSPLSATSPSKVKYSGTGRGFAGIVCYGDQPTPALLAEAINGMVLAVVEIEDEKALRRRVPEDTSMDVDVTEKRMINSLEGLMRRTPEGIPYFELCEGETLDPTFSRSIGLVLVRGVDVENAALQILTPIPRSTLQEIRQNGRHVVLVHGQFDTPTWAYTEDLYEREFGGGEDEENESDDEICAAAGVSRPWVEGVAEGRRKQAGAGTWRVRRDLGKQNRGG